MLNDCGNVIGIMIHVMTVPHLAGTSMTTPVVRDDPEPLVHEKQHLSIPVVAGERPAVVEEDHFSLFRPPVLIENVNAIAGCYVTHIVSPVQ